MRMKLLSHCFRLWSWVGNVTAERDALTKQYEAEKARIERENAASVTRLQADVAKNWGWLSQPLKAYDQKVKDITAQQTKKQ